MLSFPLYVPYANSSSDLSPNCPPNSSEIGVSSTDCAMSISEGTGDLRSSLFRRRPYLLRDSSTYTAPPIAAATPTAMLNFALSMLSATPSSGIDEGVIRAHGGIARGNA